jgi:DNA polymerase I
MHPADHALALVESAQALVVDVETTGLEPHSDHVCGWVFATPDTALYLPVRHAGGGNLFDDPSTYEDSLSWAFAKRSRLGLRTIGHNLPFDLWFAGKQGVIIDAPLEDTMLNEVLINDDLRDYDLAACTVRHDVTIKDPLALYQTLQIRFGRRGKAGRKMMADFHKLAGDDPLAVEYAVGDGISTIELWQAQQARLDADGLRPVWQLECDLIPRLARMRRRGIRVDLDYARRARTQLTADLEAALMLMPPGFEANSTASVAAYMQAQGLDWFPMTKLGKPSFREAFLEESDAGQRVIAIRRLLKTRGTFIEPILDTHAVAGRIHPDLVQFATGDYGTHTGRFSCRMPNLQAFPKRRKEIGKVVRPILIPDEGFDFGEADVSQQEPRLYAHYGEDATLIAGYNSSPPIDVHTIASGRMGINRDNAKTLGLSIFNGMQGRSLAGRLKIDRLAAENMIEDFLDIFPGIRAFRREAPLVARDRGYIRTIFGRRCYFMDPRSYYMAVSRIIQGSASDQMKLMMLRAFEYCEGNPRVQLLMSIHDSLMFQAWKGASLTEFQRVLEDNAVLNLLVPMPVDVKTGAHWGEASYGAKEYQLAEAA